tara:strand:- start:483 stop:749 length:267 start_codon:yes stop_codon:yes gene_type:complete
MKSLIRVNPESRKTRDQTMRVATVAVAGPALLYAGYKFPGTTGTKLLLMALGAGLIFTNYSTFREALDDDEEEALDEEEQRLLGIAAR